MNRNLNIGYSDVFNTPLESGLRTLVILSEIYPKTADIQRLVYFDYLIVHSGDVEGGPESLHPPTPHRTGEILVRRNIIQEGINLMLIKGLIEVMYETHGITYKASNISAPFLDYFESIYSYSLKSKSKWVAERFGDYKNYEIDKYIKNYMDVWGGEFQNDVYIKEVEFE